MDEIEAMMWSGRYVVKHIRVTSGQKHPPEVFSTNSRDQAATWLDMDGHFIVWDQKESRNIYFPEGL